MSLLLHRHRMLGFGEDAGPGFPVTVQEASNEESNTSSITVTLDNDPVESNLLVALVYRNNGADDNPISTPSGWTEIAQVRPIISANRQSVAVFTRTAGVGESKSHTFSLTTTQNTPMNGTVFEIANYGDVNLLGTFQTNGIPEISPISLNDFSVNSKSLVLCIYGWRGGVDFDSITNDFLLNEEFNFCAVFYKEYDDAASDQNADVTLTSTDRRASIVIEIEAE
jgi:hypothetical protein